MNNEQELDYEELINKYPILFKQRHAAETETCMCWGIEAGTGWYKPLDKLCSYLEELNNIYYTKYKIRIQADQVKSKYSKLCFYFSIIDDKFLVNLKKISENRQFIYDMLYNITSTLVNQCEDECYNTCEWCGADGDFNGKNLITTSHGWITRICKKCAKARTEYETKHYDEINKQEYLPRITWFHEGYEFLNPYNSNSFEYNKEIYYSIIEAFFCEKDKEHKELYKSAAKLNEKNSPHFIETLAYNFNILMEDTKNDYNLLKDIVKFKFTYEYNKELKSELLDTAGKLLQNMGKHHNNIWGHCICEECKDKEHKDLYAKILMEVRDELLNIKEK